MVEPIAAISEIVDDGTVLTVQPGGNHGDALIYLGMRKRLRESKLNWTPLAEGAIRRDWPRELQWYNPSKLVPGIRDRLQYIRHRLNSEIQAVYIHGGANFSDVWGVGLQCFRLVTTLFDCPVIVGPQTVQFDQTDPGSVLSDVSNRVRFFCRERYSYEIMKRASAPYQSVSVELAEDTALALSRADLPINQLSPDYTLAAFRADRESAVPTIKRDLQAPIKIKDISALEPSFEGFVDTAAGASRIVTDRLHVAILGGLLDIPSTLYGVNYHKSRGVYEHSLADWSAITFKPQNDAADSE